MPFLTKRYRSAALALGGVLALGAAAYFLYDVPVEEGGQAQVFESHASSKPEGPAEPAEPGPSSLRMVSSGQKSKQIPPKTAESPSAEDGPRMKLVWKKGRAVWVDVQEEAKRKAEEQARSAPSPGPKGAVAEGEAQGKFAGFKGLSFPSQSGTGSQARSGEMAFLKPFPRGAGRGQAGAAAPETSRSNRMLVVSPARPPSLKAAPAPSPKGPAAAKTPAQALRRSPASSQAGGSAIGGGGEAVGGAGGPSGGEALKPGGSGAGSGSGGTGGTREASQGRKEKECAKSGGTWDTEKGECKPAEAPKGAETASGPKGQACLVVGFSRWYADADACRRVVCETGVQCDIPEESLHCGVQPGEEILCSPVPEERTYNPSVSVSPASVVRGRGSPTLAVSGGEPEKPVVVYFAYDASGWLEGEGSQTDKDGSWSRSLAGVMADFPTGKDIRTYVTVAGRRSNIAVWKIEERPVSEPLSP